MGEVLVQVVELGDEGLERRELRQPRDDDGRADHQQPVPRAAKAAGQRPPPRGVLAEQELLARPSHGGHPEGQEGDRDVVQLLGLHAELHAEELVQLALLVLQVGLHVTHHDLELLPHQFPLQCVYPPPHPFERVDLRFAIRAVEFRDLGEQVRDLLLVRDAPVVALCEEVRAGRRRRRRRLGAHLLLRLHPREEVLQGPLHLGNEGPDALAVLALRGLPQALHQVLIPAPGVYAIGRFSLLPSRLSLTLRGFAASRRPPPVAERPPPPPSPPGKNPWPRMASRLDRPYHPLADRHRHVVVSDKPLALVQSSLDIFVRQHFRENQKSNQILSSRRGRRRDNRAAETRPKGGGECNGG